MNVSIREAAKVLGRRGLRSRWNNTTEEDRRELGQFLANARREKAEREQKEQGVEPELQ